MFAGQGSLIDEGGGFNLLVSCFFFAFCAYYLMVRYHQINLLPAEFITAFWEMSK